MISRRSIVSSVAAVLLGAFAAIGAFSGTACAAGKSIDWNAAQIRWYSFAEGMREASRSGRPVLAVFYAEWCRHCAAYGRLFQNPKVVELSRSLIMVRVDSDENPEISGRYALDGGYVPRTIVFRQDGTPVEGIHGAQDQYRYFIDYSSPRELLGVMERAAGVAPSR